MIVYVCTAVGADAHIGPCTAYRIRRSLVQEIRLSLRADVGIGPYDRYCTKRSFIIRFQHFHRCSPQRGRTTFHSETIRKLLLVNEHLLSIDSCLRWHFRLFLYQRELYAVFSLEAQLEACVPAVFLGVLRHHRHGLLTAHDDQQLPSPGDGSV